MGRVSGIEGMNFSGLGMVTTGPVWAPSNCMPVFFTKASPMAIGNSGFPDVGGTPGASLMPPGNQVGAASAELHVTPGAVSQQIIAGCEWPTLRLCDVLPHGAINDCSTRTPGIITLSP